MIFEIAVGIVLGFLLLLAVPELVIGLTVLTIRLAGIGILLMLIALPFIGLAIWTGD